MGCMCGYLDDKYRKRPWRGIPDYLNSLDAMHEAEKTLNQKQQEMYIYKLTALILGPVYAEYGPPETDPTVLRMWCTLHATARQRSDAFILTLQQEAKC